MLCLAAGLLGAACLAAADDADKNPLSGSIHLGYGAPIQRDGKNQESFRRGHLTADLTTKYRLDRDWSLFFDARKDRQNGHFSDRSDAIRTRFGVTWSQGENVDQFRITPHLLIEDGNGNGPRNVLYGVSVSYVSKAEYSLFAEAPTSATDMKRHEGRVDGLFLAPEFEFHYGENKDNAGNANRGTRITFRAGLDYVHAMPGQTVNGLRLYATPEVVYRPDVGANNTAYCFDAGVEALIDLERIGIHDPNVHSSVGIAYTNGRTAPGFNPHSSINATFGIGYRF